MGPGAIAFTLIPCSASSTAIAFVQQLETGLGGTVGRAPDAAPLSGERDDVDDLAALLLHHPARGGLGAQKTAGEVNPNDALPFFEWEIDEAPVDAEARVVHENVHAPELAHARVNELLAAAGSANPPGSL